MLYAACFLRFLLALYRAFLRKNRCLGETMLFFARRAPWLRFRPQPFAAYPALSRRRFLRRGRPLGCACGPSAGLAAAPSPRFRALWPRLPSPAAFLPLIPPVAPPLRYRASCGAFMDTVIGPILPLFFVKCLRRTFFFITISHNFHNNML